MGSVPRGSCLALTRVACAAGFTWISTDLWHDDGELAFVTDGGKVEHFAPEAAHAAFILETQPGGTALGQDVFEGGEGGLLAVLGRAPEASWTYEAVLELPSEASGYAFGAVAITNERKMVPLACD